MYNNIYELISSEENKYQTVPHFVTDKWEWRMPEHINLAILYKNSVFSTGKEDQKPFKNIIQPILNLQYTSLDFDVKDIQLFINNKDEYYKSFLLRAYHDTWARENKIDTFIDELIESYVDFGASLVKNVNSSRPEVVKLQTIAFCDQANLLGGTFAIKHSYSPAQFKQIGEESGWGNPNRGATGTIDEVISMSTETSSTPVNPNTENQTVGKNIEVYEVHGYLPDSWLNDSEYYGEKTYSLQLHIVTFYRDEKGNKKYICLFKGKEDELPFKLLLRDEIYNRALGRSGAEELFEPQVWTNWNEIIVKEMLEQASKVIYQTADTGYTTRNNTKDAENGEVWVHEEGKPATQVNTTPVSLNLFNNKINEWEAHAKQLGFANDALLGVSPTSGTPFALQELVVNTGRSTHERRRGKIAEFVAEIYRDWIIPQLQKEIVDGKEFLTELSLDELQDIADKVTESMINEEAMKQMLDGKLITREQVDQAKIEFKDNFMKKGNKRFFEILKDEFTESEVDVKVNIVGKQYNLAEKVQKLTNVFRQIFANPQILSNPQMSELLNSILESSGLNPIYFKPEQVQPQMQQQQQPPTQPNNQLALT